MLLQVETGYASNWLLDVMKTVKLCKTHVCAITYRQVSSVPVNEQDIRCSVEPIPDHYATGGYSYCIIKNSQGYWGRDHGNNEGIPNDRQKNCSWSLSSWRNDGNNFTAISGAAALSLEQKDTVSRQSC
jgi:hypothetical protein